MKIHEVENDLKLRQSVGLSPLKKGTLIHVAFFDLEVCKKIALEGVVASEILTGKEDRNDEINYCADFFKVPNDTSIEDYISWYQEFENNDSALKTKRMEADYLPRLSNYRVGIIMNGQDRDLKQLTESDAYRKDFSSIVTNLPTEKKSEKSKRIAAVLAGIPPNYISGIILPPKIMSNPVYVRAVKEIFGANVMIFDLLGNEL